MKPLSDIVIFFHEHYPNSYASPRQLSMFSQWDLQMLVDFGILSFRIDPWFGTRYYRLRKPRHIPNRVALDGWRRKVAA